MEILDEGARLPPEMPRFDDGMVNIGELIRTMAESLVNEVMDAQAEEACAEGNRRNGYRERTPVMGVGEICLRIPKLRAGTCFPEDLLTRRSRADRAVVAAVSEMDEGRAPGRRFTESSIAKAVEGAGCRPPAPTHTGDASEHAQSERPARFALGRQDVYERDCQKSRARVSVKWPARLDTKYRLGSEPASFDVTA